MGCLDSLKEEFALQISENKIKITKLPDGYCIKGEKKILFFTFWIDAKILVREHEYDIIWETNAPERKVDEALEKIRKVLEGC